MYPLENEEFLKFNVEFFRKNLRGLRYGQAFYQHFHLEKMKDKVVMDKIYNEPDTHKAIKLIHSTFVFN